MRRRWRYEAANGKRRRMKSPKKTTDVGKGGEVDSFKFDMGCLKPNCNTTKPERVDK